jgi:hypothetical protein
MNPIPWLAWWCTTVPEQHLGSSKMDFSYPYKSPSPNLEFLNHSTTSLLATSGVQLTAAIEAMAVGPHFAHSCAFAKYPQSENEEHPTERLQLQRDGHQEEGIIQNPFAPLPKELILLILECLIQYCEDNLGCIRRVIPTSIFTNLALTCRYLYTIAMPCLYSAYLVKNS